MEGWLLPDPVLLGEQSLSKERGREKELGNSFNRYVVSRMTRLYRSRNSFRFVPRFLIEGRGVEGERLSVTGVIDRRGMESIGESWVIYDSRNRREFGGSCSMSTGYLLDIEGRQGIHVESVIRHITFSNVSRCQFPDPSLYYRNSW